MTTSTPPLSAPKLVKLIADHAQPGRADKILATLFSEHEQLRHLSRSQVQRLLEEQAILINQKPLRAKDKISAGDQIQVHLAPPEKSTVDPEDIPLYKLFEDEHLLIVNKPPGLTVHPSETQKTGTLVNSLLFHVKDLSGIGGTLRPGIVHRIDKHTSGALVITKHDEVHQKLSKLFSKHEIERRYWALCYSSPQKWERQSVKGTLARSPHDRKKMAANIEGGKTAISHFEVLERYGMPEKSPFASLIEATLETGRTHQIRVHLTGLGFSILGDQTYGTPTRSQGKWKQLPTEVQEKTTLLSGQALHAKTLGFVHPMTGEKILVDAPFFSEFENLLNTLKTYSE